MATKLPRLDTKCSDCPIRHRAVCSKCDADELEELDQIKFYRSFEAGQTIAWSGDELTFVASVVRGVATLGQTLEDGRTQMLGLLLPSDFIGRPGRTSVAHDIEAVTDVTLCCFRRAPFEKMLIETPHIGERLLEMTMDELDSAREWMMILGRKSAREKVASLLTVFARRETPFDNAALQSSIAIDLPLTREAMADYLGLTLETVSRQISALKNDGVIQLDGNRHVIVPNLARLMVETGSNMNMGLHS
ncbi:Crp/Fnr family transcriptional regulator [Octadecabacter sp. CECT 8868]|uniref:transcriptional regulator FnrL n=1 Tax=Octadecabacter algicola TaxID=2909342 RepID=UPI001F48DA08|nr:Crp/Fnr family transcriptional regulator [Octadecabacter algicola]MCF2905857.1 Crp/Fnr family transcriptional regulator [Octadecabacter algicola]